ncbi:type IV pilin protein [Cytobacillus firmus]|uniref:type IV pilin protein n=1 Tax=Cytobacillus firmus TaxID=1399 RepID=UPI003BA22AF8
MELLAVIAVLGIIAAIAVLSIGGIIEKSRRDVCDANTSEVGRQYERHLHLEKVEHSEAVFGQFLMDFGEEVCPVLLMGLFIMLMVRCVAVFILKNRRGMRMMKTMMMYLFYE